MITYIHGNIFDSPAQTIVNPVNTVGIMGKGLALQFKQQYPSMFQKYQAACKNGSFKIGTLMLVSEWDHRVLLFPTKIDWRDPSKLEYIEAGLQKFVSSYQQKRITSIAFPPLGCGLGGLNWSDVKMLMEQYLSPLPINIIIYTR